MKAALDTAGKRISEVAAEGPELNIAPVKDALRDMADKARPPALFQQAPATRGIGFTFVGRQPISPDGGDNRGVCCWEADGQRSRAICGTKIAKAIAEQLGLPPEHPLAGDPREGADGSDKVSFLRTRTNWKRLLDESVNWDRAAKKHLRA